VAQHRPFLIVATPIQWDEIRGNMGAEEQCVSGLADQLSRFFGFMKDRIIHT